MGGRLLAVGGLICVVAALCSCRTARVPPWDPASGTPPPPRVLLDVEGRAQQRSLSCESRSACDLLAYLGREIDEDAFREGMPRSDNPHHGFVGDVNAPGGQLPPAGYGVYAEPVAARLRSYGFAARAVRGRDLAWLERQLAQRRPVIVWATAGMQAARAVELRDARGRPFLAVPWEHSFLVVGYGPGDIVVVDAATGEEKRVPRRRFDAAWAVLGRMAVVVETAP
ncbi:MAG: C39 family peptidase [Planctomycetota bacterium]|jgi:uncharacterized protein YvpB